MLRSFMTFAVLAFAAVCQGISQQTSQPAAAASVGQPSSSVQTVQNEDWSKLPVDRTVLPSYPRGTLLGKDDKDTFSREIIRFEWRAGDAVEVYVIKPHGVEKPQAILYLYGIPSDTDRFRDDQWCRHATSHGLAAIGFISAMTGGRYKGRPMKQWFVSELQEAMGSSAHDVQLIVDYVASRKDLSADHVGMFAQGSGAAIAILTASVDPRITVLDLLNPWGDWPDWLRTSPVVPENERPNYVTPEFLEKVSGLDPARYLPQLSDRKLRVQQVMDYADVPPAPRDKIAASVPAGSLVQYKDKAAHEQAWHANGLSGWIAGQFTADHSAVAAKTKLP